MHKLTPCQASERGVAASPLYQNLLPAERIEPIDVSNAVVYLASDEGRHVTG